MRADEPSEAGPVIRTTNAVLVHAIDNDILKFQVPAAEDSSFDNQIAGILPDYLQPWFIRRLQVMTTPKTGTILLTHQDKPYNVSVEFDNPADGRPRVRVKLNRL